MTKEEAREAIKEVYGNSEYTDEIIKALEQEPQWISAKERLPEKDCAYLVTTGSGLKIISFANDLYKVDEYDFWDKKGVSGWFDYDSEYGYIEMGAIAWMPLPPSYQETCLY